MTTTSQHAPAVTEAPAAHEIVDVTDLSSHELRDSLGRFCTGVTVIAAAPNDTPVGFAAQSFTALSLDPPLILFCPAKTSRSWARMEAAGSLSISVLSEDQEEICTTFASKRDDKFTGIAWTPNRWGAPRIDGAIGYFDCTIAEVLDGGDHWIVVCRVTGLGKPGGPLRPLLFYRGAYVNLKEDGALLEHPPLSNFLTADVWY